MSVYIYILAMVGITRRKVFCLFRDFGLHSWVHRCSWLNFTKQEHAFHPGTGFGAERSSKIFPGNHSVQLFDMVVPALCNTV